MRTSSVNPQKRIIVLLGIVLFVLPMLRGRRRHNRHIQSQEGGEQRHRQLDCERDAIREAFARYPGARLAHTDFQRAKYFVPDMEVIDLSGLNHRGIAHATTGEVNPYGKHDLNYALPEKAELLKLGTGVMEYRIITNDDWLGSLREDGEVARDFRNARQFLLANADELRRDYMPVAIETVCSGSYLNLLVRRDAVRAD